MPEPQADSGSTRTLEIAHVLFMDIVAYSQLPMDEQTRLIEKLQQIVRNTTEFGRAQKRRQLCASQRAMAWLWFSWRCGSACPLRCGDQSRHTEQPDLKLRMGIHTGPVSGSRISTPNAMSREAASILRNG